LYQSSSTTLLRLRFRRVYINKVTCVILSDRLDKCICNHLLIPGFNNLSSMQNTCWILRTTSYLRAKEKWAEALGEKFLGLSCGLFPVGEHTHTHTKNNY